MTRRRIVAQRTVAVIGRILPYAAGADLDQNKEEDEAEREANYTFAYSLSNSSSVIFITSCP